MENKLIKQCSMPLLSDDCFIRLFHDSYVVIYNKLNYKTIFTAFSACQLFIMHMP